MNTRYTLQYTPLFSVLITIQQTLDPGLPAGAGNRDNGGYKLYTI